MLEIKQPKDLQTLFENSGVWAYPTEAVYGLGCNPDDEQAVHRLLAIKKRSIDKGLILIAADFSQVEKYLKPLNKSQRALTKASATTYIYPALESAPHWLRGQYDGLAVRITRHPVAKGMCEALGSAIVSTSANLSGKEPAKSHEDVLRQFSECNNNHGVDAVLLGKLGDSTKPSEIRDSISGKIIRA